MFWEMSHPALRSNILSVISAGRLPVRGLEMVLLCFMAPEVLGNMVHCPNNEGAELPLQDFY